MLSCYCLLFFPPLIPYLVLKAEIDKKVFNHALNNRSMLPHSDKDKILCIFPVFIVFLSGFFGQEAIFHYHLPAGVQTATNPL